MTSYADATEARGQSAGAIRLVYTLTVFSSAFLMFAIQPMFTKMVLPQLGGSPGVWSVAMVFFQTLLLLGYLYAHLSSKYLSLRAGVVVHVALLLITTLALPIAIASGWGRPPTENQIPWLLGVFAASVGLPFFAIAGNGPLLQSWFARTGHKDRANPYFLYAASNLGSFAALLLYPLVFETLLKLSQQSAAWSTGFGLLGILISAAGWQVLRGGEGKALPRMVAGPEPGWAEIGKWIWLALVPSGLLIAVTSYISTDVASAPFLWIIPLSLFLLTFVLIFRDRPLVPPRWIEIALPILVALLVLTKIFDPDVFIAIAINLGFFFAATMFCHQQLYERRPDAAHLTQFYLWMSFGGVLGGIFVGLLAPFMFNRILEFPILACIVMFAHPALQKPSQGTLFKQALPVIGIGIIAVLGLQLMSDAEDVQNGFLPFIAIALGSFGIIALYKRPVIQAALIPCLFIFSEATFGSLLGSTYMRSFFGVNEVTLREAGQFRVLVHGITMHGAQRITNTDGTPYAGPAKPLTYYHPDGLLAETLRAVPGEAQGRTLGVVGLGSGSHVCNGTRADRWTYFEIDAAVARIATDPKLFTFLPTCAPETRIVMGDARLTLADEPAAKFDYLLIDAFSSDSIPAHLLTREAITLYMSKLKPNGLLAVHISNKHLALQQVVAALATDAGLAVKANALIKPKASLEEATSAAAAVFARKPETLAAFKPERGWIVPDAQGVAPWTDDYSNIPGAIWRKYSGLN
jgi:hypothetical protein